MMRFNGESLHTIDVNVDGINLMDSSPVQIDENFTKDVERGKFISEE